MPFIPEYWPDLFTHSGSTRPCGGSFCIEEINSVHSPPAAAAAAQVGEEAVAGETATTTAATAVHHRLFNRL